MLSLKIDGKPYPFRNTFSARRNTYSGVLRDSCKLLLGCNKCISSIISSNKIVNAFKTEMDSKKKEKLKIDHIANMKKLNTELDAAKKDYDKIVNKITGADILYDEEE